MRFNHSTLKKIRESRPGKVQQEKVAAILGIDQSAYSNKEKGKSPISLQEIQKLADFYRIDILEFFEGVVDKNKIKGGDEANMETLKEMLQDALELKREYKKQVVELKQEIAILKSNAKVNP